MFYKCVNNISLWFYRCDVVVFMERIFFLLICTHKNNYKINLYVFNIGIHLENEKTI